MTKGMVVDDSIYHQQQQLLVKVNVVKGLTGMTAPGGCAEAVDYLTKLRCTPDIIYLPAGIKKIPCITLPYRHQNSIFTCCPQKDGSSYRCSSISEYPFNG